MTSTPETPARDRPSPEEVIRQNRKRLRPLPVSVRWLILAGLIAAAFAICHAMGLRESVSVVLGTGERSSPGAAMGGAFYLALYLAAVIMSPILVIAAGIHAVLSRLLNRRPPLR